MLLTKVWLSDVTSKENQGYLIVVPYFLHFFTMLGTYGAYQAIYVMPGLFIGWMKCSSVLNLLKRFKGLLDVVNQVVNVFNSY